MSLNHLEHVYWRASFVERRHRKRAAPEGDVLTPPEALRVVRMANVEGMAWLRENGLIRTFQGRPRVLRKELLQAYDRMADDERVVETSFVGIPTEDELDL